MQEIVKLFPARLIFAIAPCFKTLPISSLVRSMTSSQCDTLRPGKRMQKLTGWPCSMNSSPWFRMRSRSASPPLHGKRSSLISVALAAARFFFSISRFFFFCSYSYLPRSPSLATCGSWLGANYENCFCNCNK